MKSQWEIPDCNLCGNKALRVFLDRVTTWEHPGQFTYLKCPQCSLVFQSPRPKFNQAVNYYPSTTYWGRNVKKFEPIPDLANQREKTYGQIYAWVRHKGLHPGKILDIGSGLGLFLSQFKQWGWQTLGTDISPDIVAYSRKVFGIETKVGEVTQLKLPRHHFDLVTLISVLEHVYDPLLTLKTVHRLLMPGGYVVIFVPNIGGLGRYIFGRNWVQLQPARHLYLFSPRTLTSLLTQTGFTLERISHWSWEHNWYSHYQSLRMAFSPKFRTSGKPADVLKKSPTSLKLEGGKLAAGAVTAGLIILGWIFGRGEMMTVYARKT